MALRLGAGLLQSPLLWTPVAEVEVAAAAEVPGTPTSWQTTTTVPGGGRGVPVDQDGHRGDGEGAAGATTKMGDNRR